MNARRGFGAAGFTLIEAITVMVIAGIVSAIVVVFIRTPVEGYFDTVRRAAMTDEADTSLRFVARELRAALPNSVACASAGGSGTLTFLAVRSGGRYRESRTAGGNGAPLQFGAAGGGFDTIGGGGDATLRDAHGQAVAAGTAVIGNLGGVAACDARQGAPANTPGVTQLNANSVTFAVGTPAVSEACNLQTAAANGPNDRNPGRFFMIDPNVVTYACGPAGLTRAAGAGTAQTLSARVSACQIACATGANMSIQTISLQLVLTDAGESMTLFRQVHVENYP